MKVFAKKNPIIGKQGVCDPHIHIFNDKAYLYASHDAADGRSGYETHDWEIWSSPDLVTWEKESVVHPEDTPMGNSKDCWAVDAEERDGKYYLYVSDGNRETYVLASDDPGRGFREVLGKPILPMGLTPTRSYDPALFTDDDGKSYIVFGTPVWAGGDSYYIARLNDDMVSLAEAPRKIIVNDGADDKPVIHKRNGIYYLSWASYYATSDNIYGPYTYRGNLNLTMDHTSVFEWHGQWFMAFTVNETITDHIRRATGIAYIHYKENGEMCSDTLIREYGVGQYDGGWHRIDGVWYMRGENVEKKENTYDGFDVKMTAGSSISFPNIHNVPENPYLVITGVSEKDVDIEVYEDDKLLGVVKKPASSLKGGEYTKYNLGILKLDIPAGDHNLKFVSKGDILFNNFCFHDR